MLGKLCGDSQKVVLSLCVVLIEIPLISWAKEPQLKWTKNCAPAHTLNDVHFEFACNPDSQTES
jgi:hypothetical protein